MNRIRANLSVLILLALALSLTGGGPIGQAAPFKADKLAVLCLEDSSAQGRAKLTTNQENILRAQDDTSVRKFVKDHGGEMQVLDPKNPATFDFDWVKAAMVVAHGEPPWILAASPRGGFSSAIAPDAQSADLTKKLASIAL